MYVNAQSILFFLPLSSFIGILLKNRTLITGPFDPMQISGISRYLSKFLPYSMEDVPLISSFPWDMSSFNLAGIPSTTSNEFFYYLFFKGIIYWEDV